MKIQQAAKIIGISTRTIKRWEEKGFIPRAKRDKSGWRYYNKEDIAIIRGYYLNIGVSSDQWQPPTNP